MPPGQGCRGPIPSCRRPAAVLTWRAEWSAVSLSACEDNNPTPGPTLGTTCDLNPCPRGPISRTVLAVRGPHVDVGGHGPPGTRRGRAGACGGGTALLGHAPRGASPAGLGGRVLTWAPGAGGREPGFWARPSQHGQASRPEHNLWPLRCPLSWPSWCSPWSSCAPTSAAWLTRASAATGENRATG